MPELSAKARVSTDSCASLGGLFIVERGLFASHDPLEEISAGRYRIRRPEFRPANIPCNSFATTPANVVTQVLWSPGNCLSCTARANLRQVEGSYSMRAAFSSHTKQ